MSRKSSRPKALGQLEQLVLLALLRLRDDVYGLPIREEIESRTGRAISAGALYTALSRLESRGLVSSRFGEPTAERGGKRKKYFRIESEGLEALRSSWSAVDSMAAGLEPELRGG